MLLDLIFAAIVVFAVLKGYKKGLIIGLFSLVAVIIGLAAAMKLSVIMASYLGTAVNISDEWMPVISFAVVFLLVVLLIRLGAKLIERTVEFVMMGWLNKLGGILLFATLYIAVFSVLLFYAEQLKLVQAGTIDNSLTYSFIQPWGPKAINGFGAIVPFFGGMFEELKQFFEGVANNISKN